MKKKPLWHVESHIGREDSHYSRSADKAIVSLLATANLGAFDDYFIGFTLHHRGLVVGGVRHRVDSANDPRIAPFTVRVYDFEIIIAERMRGSVGAYLLMPHVIAAARALGADCVFSTVVDRGFHRMLTQYFGFRNSYFFEFEDAAYREDALPFSYRVKVCLPLNSLLTCRPRHRVAPAILYCGALLR